MRYINLVPHNSLVARLTATSFLFSLANETSGLLLALYARSLGASNLEVGLIAASYGTAYFVASLVFGRQSDIHGRLIFVRIGLGLLVIAYASLIFTPNPQLLLVARGFVGFCMGIASASIIAYNYDQRKEIGHFTAYGSAGLFIGAILVAVLQNYEAMFITSAISSVLAFIISLTFKEETQNRARVPLVPVSLLKANYIIYFAFFMRQLGGWAVFAILPLYFSSLGASNTWIALFDAINMGGQFLIMRFIERFNYGRIFQTGLFLSVMVFVIYSLVDNYLQLIPAQILLGLAWSCLYVGALGHLLKNNQEKGTVSGVLYSMFYLSAGVGPSIGGALSQTWGYLAVMYFGSGFTFVGFLSSLWLKHPKKP